MDDYQIARELGERARKNHDPEAAQAHYEKAVALLRTSDDKLTLAHTIRHLGDVHAERQNWTSADQCIAEALSIYRSYHSPGRLDLANAIRSCAVVHSAIGQRESASALWREACALYEAEGIAPGVDECRRELEQLT